MTTHDGASDAVDPEAWLTADRIAELSGGRVKPNTVRSWWRSGALEFEVFPELGTKSNKRSDRQVVERFLRRKLGQQILDEGPLTRPLPRQPQASTPNEARIADLVDTLSSVKAAADSAMAALISESEQHAKIAAAQAVLSRAQADADAMRAEAEAQRVETLKHLQNMFRGYDLALTTHLQPATPEGVAQGAD
jgi:hypothetical protein